eukprot:3853034-Pyramimonas_sp.AAC.1
MEISKAHFSLANVVSGVVQAQVFFRDLKGEDFTQGIYTQHSGCATIMDGWHGIGGTWFRFSWNSIERQGH